MFKNLGINLKLNIFKQITHELNDFNFNLNMRDDFQDI